MEALRQIVAEETVLQKRCQTENGLCRTYAQRNSRINAVLISEVKIHGVRTQGGI